MAAAGIDDGGLALKLTAPSPAAWLDAVMNDFDAFLLDHASNERKASAQALSLVAHYPDKTHLVETLIELAREELAHFQAVVRIASARGLSLPPDQPDPYVQALRARIRRGPEVYFLDRLLVGGVVEARGCERFGLIADALCDASGHSFRDSFRDSSSKKEVANFYREIADSEARHADLFVDLAARYFDKPVVETRLAEIIADEAEIVQELTIRAALH